MPRENHPRMRQARALARKQGQRPPYDRVLIVTEGGKTEPLYFGDIRQQNRVPSAHITIMPSALGTEPLQVVDFAWQAFLQDKAYERVFAVFDRDQHPTYHNALARAAALDQSAKNDERKPVRFLAVPSVPCFELWLLLHFREVHAFWDHHETIRQLRGFLPHYTKGGEGVYGATEPTLADAIQRAIALSVRFTAETGTDPYTKVHDIVTLLRSIRHQ